MKTHIAEVLNRERACLAAVSDRAALAAWRCRVVQELMTPRSSYVLALRETGDAHDRSDFVDQWRDLLSEAVGRLLRSDAAGNGESAPDDPRRAGVDPEKIAVLILAALHGGSVLSGMEQDPRPLNAALDLALAPFSRGPASELLGRIGSDQ
ncbi:hypothetical protein [Streptomyces sp. NRRL F-5126]|uniref:hypothetical protein n=1 Tax=Streptomyces sp. NRRL F-5126 TaxID=1463857 RepID=UPI00131D95D6|nr:hypothetical protein [Streptomyces sp. NRRL F-5126]